MIEKTMENLKKCICIKCKSYTVGCKLKEMPKNMVEIIKHHKHIDEIEHLEGFFCAFGKSKCITEEKECICGECPITKENNLTKGYYCTKGLQND